MAEEQITKSANGIKDVVIQRILANNVDDAIALFEDHSVEVDKAIREYNTSTHEIMYRKDKVRKNKSEYQTNKLPRNWQQYINEIELYFLLNNGIVWELQNEDQETDGELQKAFSNFSKFLEEVHYFSRTREAKRLAGAETECAKLYSCYTIDGEKKYRLEVLSKSKGFILRPLFNIHNDLRAFAVGYQEKDYEGNLVNVWDIYTSETIYHCRCTADGTTEVGWKVETENNVFKKIPIIYIRQPKAWEGVQERIDRDEWLDSKNADCNEYFADPMLKISKSVKNGLMEPKATGKVIQVTNKDDVFEYVTPPDATDMKTVEKSILKESILNGSFTPDFSFDNVKGLGAISGNAIMKATYIGYVKRNMRMDIYDEVFSREGHLLTEILAESKDPQNRKAYRRMELKHTYPDPAIGMEDNSEEISRWAEIGMSDEAIVESNRNVSNKKLELQRLRKKRQELAAQEAKVVETSKE